MLKIGPALAEADSRDGSAWLELALEEGQSDDAKHYLEKFGPVEKLMDLFSTSHVYDDMRRTLRSSFRDYFPSTSSQ